MNPVHHLRNSPVVRPNHFEIGLTALVGAMALIVWLGLWPEASPNTLIVGGLAVSIRQLIVLVLCLIVGYGVIWIVAAHRREVRLLESIRHWQLIFEQASWGAAIGTPDELMLVQMNSAYARMHGDSFGQLIGQPIETVFPLECRKELAEATAMTRKIGHYRYESLHRRQDGGVFPVVMDLSTVCDASGEIAYYIIYVQDISEIRDALDKARIAKESFHQAFEAAPVGMLVTDATGRYTRVNRAMCEFTGYSESELLGMDYVDITHPDDDLLPGLTRELSSDSHYQSFQIEKRYVRKNGGEVWALLVALRVSDDHGVPLYWMGQVLDIDSLKRAERALRHSEERFRSVFENANTGIVVADKTGHIAYFNEAFRLMLGHDAEVVRQMHFADFSVPEERAKEIALFSEIIESRRDRYRTEKRWIAHDGQIVWVDLYLSTILDDSAEVVNFMAVVADITDGKKSAAALGDSKRKLRALAAHQEGMLELERKRIAGEVHDEMGQLLTALKMDISLLRLRFGENTQLLGMIDGMRSLVDQTINVVRQVASNLRPAVLDHGLAPAIEWLAADFSKRGTVRCRIDTDGGGFELPEMQSTAIFRVVQESLTNVTRHAQAREVTISMQRSGQQLQVVVKDDGNGFDTVAVGKASGFGLFGMRERVLALGGTLRIASAPGKGTAVTIKLPLVSGDIHDTYHHC